MGDVLNYYNSKISNYGTSARGVDWNGEESQALRFHQLCKILSGSSKKFTLNDLGCGYGALIDYLDESYSDYQYIGIDISNQMIEVANNNYGNRSDIRFLLAEKPDQVSDYSIASGIFNVRINASDNEWFEYIQTTLEILNNSSRLGFSFNCLTTYSDTDKRREYLYYADPCQIFDLCKRRFSKNVALLHDYGLYEFTILVKK